MKNFKVKEICWATYSDLNLPFYRDWNRQNRIPGGFRQRIWEYPFVLLHIPKNDSNLDVGGTYPFILFKNFPNTVSLDSRDLNNLDHPLHKGLWPAGKLIVGDALKMPRANESFRYSFSISSLEEMPDPLQALKEMIRVTRERVVVTMDVSDILGIDRRKLGKILGFLGVELPPVPKDVLRSDDPRQVRFGKPQLSEYSHIKVLGIVIDKEEKIKDCGILIPHAESFPFLKACVCAIRENRNPRVNQHIYILDDSSKDGSFEKAKRLFGRDGDITILQVKRDNPQAPDIGQVLDEGLKYVKEQYVAMIDADVFPMSKHWLSYPIYLIERFNCSSVGCDTGLSSAYIKKLPGDWRNRVDYVTGFRLFSNAEFTCTNNFYRVSRTVTAKIVSQLVGYRLDALKSPINETIDRTVNRVIRKVNAILGRRIIPCISLGFPAADNGVYASYFLDRNRLGPKFCLPIVSWAGFTPTDGVFGQNICNLILHFALSSRVLSRSHKDIQNAGKDYMRYAKRIKEKGFGPALLKEIWDRVDAEGVFPLPSSWDQYQYSLFKDSFQGYLSAVREGGLK